MPLGVDKIVEQNNKWKKKLNQTYILPVLLRSLFSGILSLSSIIL